ncbi:MAG: hypothetical protein JWM80_5801 [Cyanobacteria bacterium RYN_339]|nr:hypothetical protein [Cyanobacteria bacterium RYN_339]
MADDELESHLADRLKETKDIANFTRRPKGSESAEVERVLELPDHLGGRKISDKFTRTGKVPAAQPVAEEPGKPKGLEHHLKSRLAEIEDTPISRGSKLEDSLEAYRKLRRDMGGSGS